jgi:hypothetical protein
MSMNVVYSIYCGSTYGPIFGSGNDISIMSNSNLNQDSISKFGRSYKHPDYQYETEKAKSILAGSEYFQTVEIEVFVATN